MTTHEISKQDNLPLTAWFLVGQSTKASSNGLCVPVRGPTFSVGRRHDADLSLSSRTVSSQHAELDVIDADRLMIRDLGSTNGTYVNGNPVSLPIELKAGDLIQFADVAVRLQRQSNGEDAHTLAENVYDKALAVVQLDKLLTERAVAPYYQPIIEIRSGRVVGYEVLGRSRLLGVETPGAMFQAAAQMDLEVQLSEMLRWEGVRRAQAFAQRPHLFANTHPAELKDPGFARSLTALREAFPQQALTLEIHEAAVTDVHAMQELRKVLSDLDIGFAYDDFGAGQARLVELVGAKPDYLKFDISLVRNLDQATPVHQQLVASLVRIAHDLDVTPLAEGVERQAESKICEELGFLLGQGFYYGRPAPVDADLSDTAAGSAELTV